MNVETVSRATAGLAAWLRDRCLGGGLVLVGRDARYGSAEFATATAEVFAAAGFSVLELSRPLPTPIVAFAVRELGAVAGVQITASHNPATDNGYKVYLDGGSQLIPPADSEIEAAIDAVTGPVPRTDVAASAPSPAVLGLPGDATADDCTQELIRRYLARITVLPTLFDERNPAEQTPATVSEANAFQREDSRAGGPEESAPGDDVAGVPIRPVGGDDSPDRRYTADPAGAATAQPARTATARSNHRPLTGIRIALTPMHGVGGELAVAALHAAGFTDVHVVEEQFQPDPDFPTVAFPNPEEPGASDLLLALAEKIGADLAVALDPDADRCAVGVPGPDGWRMLRGDETGVLLGDFVLRGAPSDALAATTIVSSRLLSKLAPARGARYAETLTGFKWLARAGAGLVYAYEEAIGHCVDPNTVRDKDGISAAVAAALLVTELLGESRTVTDRLDDFALEFGLHAGDQVSLRLDSPAAAAEVVARLRNSPPQMIAGAPVTCTDLATVRGPLRTDALIFESSTQRLVVRPSGTEPKLKWYLEVVEPVADRADLPAAATTARTRLAELRAFCESA
ncbi:phospho-sugar mutase [Nocardia stercoris]